MAGWRRAGLRDTAQHGTYAHLASLRVAAKRDSGPHHTHQTTTNRNRDGLHRKLRGAFYQPRFCGVFFSVGVPPGVGGGVEWMRPFVGTTLPSEAVSGSPGVWEEESTRQAGRASLT